MTDTPKKKRATVKVIVTGILACLVIVALVFLVHSLVIILSATSSKNAKAVSQASANVDTKPSKTLRMTASPIERQVRSSRCDSNVPQFRQTLRAPSRPNHDSRGIDGQLSKW